jgi:hypothetical protein
MVGAWARRASALVTVVTLLSLFAPTSLAGAATYRARSGSETATISFAGTFPEYRDVTLVVRRAGAVVDQQPVRSKWCGGACGPSIYPSPASVIRFVRLGGGTTRDVVLSLYSGGAHCCTIEQVYSARAGSSRWKVVEHDFGDPGVRLIASGVRGSDVFLSANDVFAYKFTHYAASGMPIEILAYDDGAFRDVTRTFPRLIARDAATWIKAFRGEATSHYGDTVGVIAAWAADEDMLGRSAIAQRFLVREAGEGHLNSALGTMEPHGTHFVSVLDAFLRRQGYLR